MATKTAKKSVKKATKAAPKKAPGLLERLAKGPVICAEGYLFEFERRGYLQAGAFVPEVVLEHPDLVEGLHRDFVHAGSDVVEAFTYYAHRAKMRMVNREGDLERINRTALRLAKKVARETDTLLAGNICNTSIYGADDAKSHKQARRIFDEQIDWAMDAGVDFIVGETYSWGGEALLALEAIKRSGKPAVITLAVPREGRMREGWSVGDTARRLEAAGAEVVGVNCSRGPATMMPLLREIRSAVSCHVAGAAGALSHHAGGADLPVAHGPELRRHPGQSAVPRGPRSVRLQPLRDRRVREGSRTRSGSAISACAAARGRITCAASRRASGAGPRRAATPPTCRSTSSSAPTSGSVRTTSRTG